MSRHVIHKQYLPIHHVLTTLLNLFYVRISNLLYRSFLLFCPLSHHSMAFAHFFFQFPWKKSECQHICTLHSTQQVESSNKKKWNISKEIKIQHNVSCDNVTCMKREKIIKYSVFRMEENPYFSPNKLKDQPTTEIEIPKNCGID